jgi:transcriptional regulator with XRE-family HTH domain
MAKQRIRISPLREVRLFSGCSILEAARVAGVSFTTLSNFERGFAELSDRQIENLKQFYFVQIAKCMKRVAPLLKG